MADPVERFGFTVLNTGVKGDGDIPLVKYDSTSSLENNFLTFTVLSSYTACGGIQGGLGKQMHQLQCESATTAHPWNHGVKIPL